MTCFCFLAIAFPFPDSRLVHRRMWTAHRSPIMHVHFLPVDMPVLAHHWLQNVDRIYVLSDGLVAEQGTHAQLMAGGRGCCQRGLMRAVGCVHSLWEGWARNSCDVCTAGWRTYIVVPIWCPTRTTHARPSLPLQLVACITTCGACSAPRRCWKSTWRPRRRSTGSRAAVVQQPAVAAR